MLLFARQYTRTCCSSELNWCSLSPIQPYTPSPNAASSSFTFPIIKQSLTLTLFSPVTGFILLAFTDHFWYVLIITFIMLLTTCLKVTLQIFIIIIMSSVPSTRAHRICCYINLSDAVVVVVVVDNFSSSSRWSYNDFYGKTTAINNNWPTTLHNGQMYIGHWTLDTGHCTTTS